MAEDIAATDENITTETQAPVTDTSSTSENNELEVVHEGQPVKAEVETESRDEEETQDKTSDEAADKTDETTDETESEEQPREKRRGAQQRIRQLVQEKRQYESIIKSLNPDFDIRNAVENGVDETAARLDAMEYNQTRDQLNQQIAEVNMGIKNEADEVLRDFDFMDGSKERSPEDKALAQEVMDIWSAGTEVLRDSNGDVQFDREGSPVFTDAGISLYQLANLVEKARDVAYKAGQSAGQRNAEKQLASVEIPTGAAPKKSSSDDASLSAEDYAKKHGLTVV